MERSEQLLFCEKCINRKMDLKRGIICGLTDNYADFNNECDDYLYDEKVEKNESLYIVKDSELKELRSEQNLRAGLFGATLLGLITAIIWAEFTVRLGFQIGWLALVIGAGVGFGMRIFGKGIEQYFGLAGAVIALLSTILGNVLSIIGLIGADTGLTIYETIFVFNYSYLPELFIEFFSPIDLVFYAVSAYEGYRFSFRPLERKEAV